MNAKEKVRAKHPFAVCHKIRGEGRYRVRRGKYDGWTLGTGETAALAWRAAADAIAPSEPQSGSVAA